MDPNSDCALLESSMPVPLECAMDCSDTLHLGISGIQDRAGSSSSSNSHKPSYDSRESKSISECSYLSGSPRESPLLDPQPLGMATPFSSTGTMESEGDHTLNPSEGLPGYDPFQSEKEFIDYLMSLPSPKFQGASTKPSTQVSSLEQEQQQQQQQQDSGHCLEAVPLQTKPSATAARQGPKIGLDHLENLCKLMEQLGELREQNFKLQKRVQHLEEVRCLNEMRRDLKEALDIAIPDLSIAKKMAEPEDSTQTSEDSTTYNTCSKSTSKSPLSSYDPKTSSLKDPVESYRSQPAAVVLPRRIPSKMECTSSKKSSQGSTS